MSKGFISILRRRWQASSDSAGGRSSFQWLLEPGHIPPGLILNPAGNSPKHCEHTSGMTPSSPSLSRCQAAPIRPQSEPWGQPSSLPSNSCTAQYLQWRGESQSSSTLQAPLRRENKASGSVHLHLQSICQILCFLQIQMKSKAFSTFVLNNK